MFLTYPFYIVYRFKSNIVPLTQNPLHILHY
nr:MAG TPA: hypothetical protein [Caudoviricetes sp.]